MKEKTPAQKPLIVKKSVRHVFTPAEIAGLNVDFRQAFANLRSVEAEFDNVRASYKAKVTEAEARMATLDATLQAGCEQRDKECVVIFDVPNAKKHFHIAETYLVGNITGQPAENNPLPVLTENMTPADFEQDLLRAESAFDDKSVIPLWEADTDHGVIVVGKLAGKWFSAVRGNVGQSHKLDERLDSEQKCFKKRADAIEVAGKRAMDWLEKSLGKDAAKGFADGIASAVLKEVEKVE